MTVNDSAGSERIGTHYMRMKTLGQMLEHGLLVYNDEQEKFEKLVEFDLAEKWRRPQGHPVQWNDGPVDYFYFPAPYATVRVRADWSSVTNPSRYEALTFLENDGQFDAKKARAARATDGMVR